MEIYWVPFTCPEPATDTFRLSPQFENVLKIRKKYREEGLGLQDIQGTQKNLGGLLPEQSCSNSIRPYSSRINNKAPIWKEPYSMRRDIETEA